MKSNTDYVFWRELKDGKPYLTKQQYRTLKGQAVKGNVIMHEKVCKEFYTGRTGEKNVHIERNDS